ncbi:MULTISPECIES: hypothetical protein [Corynebacterium]|uniref:hypothetical protein n=1 Tax=Corynebacterium TaxID=1716 RepID=UPI00114D2560|nr:MULTISPECIES: hypothetical protein [Corynebacterium]TRX53583.1 hypothetical protein FNY91_03875 [Corynebacterium guaraldiae]
MSSAQWDPAAAWRRRPGAYPVRVSELELTHAQLMKVDGWKNVFQQWAPRCWTRVRLTGQHPRREASTLRMPTNRMPIHRTDPLHTVPIH